MPIPQLPKRKTTTYGRTNQTPAIETPAYRSTKLRGRDLQLGKIKNIGTLLFTGGALFVIISLITVAWISRDLPDPNKLNARHVAQSTKIYDRTGQHLLYEIFQDQKRTLVELDQIAPIAVQATIAVEDKRFYEHRGVRVASIIRAGFNNAIGRKSGSGGASTLTQQLIKNTLVGSERRGFGGLFRKIKEAILAMRLERKYSKEDILKLYLNEIPYGSTNYGIEAASQSYFHKSAKELNTAEAATLAAIIKAPSRYLNNPDALRDRRDVVLRLMYEQGYISEEEKNQSQGTALRLYRNNGIFDAPHFVLHVKQLLAEEFGEKNVDSGGYKVITTLDYDRQKLAEEVVKKNSDKFAKDANANNAALSAIDPKTGHILAMVGSRDFANEEINGQFNIVTLGKLQPGSSFKPFVYTAAFEKGYTPDTVLYDVLTNFDRRSGGNYTPKNYDGKEYGLVTMRKALQGSLNIPAVKTLYLVGEKPMIEFAKRFGYTTFTGDYGLSLVLGSGEVNLLEHTNAYAALANRGVYRAPVSILKVAGANGEVLREWKESPGSEAISPDLAATISNVLSDNNARAFIFGRSNNLVLPGRPVAAKTGTTNDSKDAWTVGYTPSLAAGVWVGNTPNKTPMKGGGNKLAGLIWNEFMRGALKDTPVEQFPPTPPNDATKPVLRGGDGGIKLRINTITGRIAPSSTPTELVVEKTFLPPHDILHYVDKNNPRAEQPPNPADDPQYENWEAALEDWVRRLNEKGTIVSLEEPPTETDPVGSPELSPTIDILSPADGSTLTSRTMEIRATAIAPRGVFKVIYQIDQTTIGESVAPPFELSYYAKTLGPGPHTLKIIAQDDQGNAAEKSIQFTLDAVFDPPDFNWLDTSPLSLRGDDFPRPIAVAPFRWEETKEIQIFLATPGSKKLIYTFNHQDKINNHQLQFTWKNSPGAGTHTLVGILTDKSGRTTEKELVVQVE